MNKSRFTEEQITMRHTGLLGYLLAGAIVGACAPAGAREAPTTQRTRTITNRYERAAKLLRAPAMAGVKNALVIPRWIGGSDRFWYRRETASGAEFVVVDAATGVRNPAFDGAAVARSLSALIGEAVAATPLPFATIQFSADGAAVSFRVKDGTFRCQVQSSACERLPSSPPGDLAVSPDGRLGAFTRDGNLWIRDLASGQERALTTDGTPDNGWGVAPDPSDFRSLIRERAGVRLPPFLTFWSPDSRRLIVSRVDQRGVAPYPYLEYAPPDGSFRPKVRTTRLALAGEKPAGIELFAFDLATGTRQRADLPYARLSLVQMGKDSFDWSQDAEQFFISAAGNDLQGASLFDLEVASGRIREVIHERAVYPALFNAGGYGAHSVQLIDGGSQVIWYSQRDGWGHLYLYDVATGRLKNKITDGRWVVRDLVRVDETRRRVYFTASGREPGNPYYRFLYRINLDGSGLTSLSPEPGDKLIISPKSAGPSFDGAQASEAVSPSNRYVVYNAAAIDAPTTTMIRRTDDASLVSVVEKADATALFAAGYRPPQEFVVKAADDKSDLYGVIYRPSDYDLKKKYPVIDAEYGSPVTTITPRNFLHAAFGPVDFVPPAATAELGFIIMVVDARGTPFRGAAFSDPAPGYIATMGLEDHVAALRALAAKDPSLDLNRVGISGASFGGWTAVRALLAFGDVYKVGVAGATPGAFYSMYDAAGLTIPNGLPAYANGGSLRPNPSDKPLNWGSMDNVQQVERLKGKLLFLLGALDENVPPASTLQLVEAAMKADKNVDLVFVPNGNHGGFYSPFAIRKIWNYLVENLQGVIAPGDFRIPADAPAK